MTIWVLLIVEIAAVSSPTVAARMDPHQYSSVFYRVHGVQMTIRTRSVFGYYGRALLWRSLAPAGSRV